MRYLSLILIIGLMAWTWSVIKKPTDLTEYTHMGIQEDLKRIISEYIQENVPGVKGFKFERFWTEALKEDKVKATFSYSFDEQAENPEKSARIGVAGYAILNRSKEQNSEFDIWSLDELKVLDNSLIYKEGSTIRSASASSTTDDEHKEQKSHE